MKGLRILSLVVCMALWTMTAVVSAGKTSFSGGDESLTYRVMFKWGLINKRAGTATLTLDKGAKEYTAQLTARSEPWADRIYRVRDTLNGRMTLRDFTPLMYEKIAHEGDDHKHDVVKYSRSGNEVTGDCIRRVFKNGKLKVDERRELTAEGTTVDMLTSFYFMRALPFESWVDGHEETVNIFSGKRKELLTIKYHGKVDLKIDGTSHQCYYITFLFTSAGGKKTSDDMEAWISADTARIPLRLEGKLPVGKVHCILENP